MKGIKRFFFKLYFKLIGFKVFTIEYSNDPNSIIRLTELCKAYFTCYSDLNEYIDLSIRLSTLYRFTLPDRSTPFDTSNTINPRVKLGYFLNHFDSTIAYCYYQQIPISKLSKVIEDTYNECNTK